MTHDQDDTLIRAALAPARTLEPTDAELAAVLARLGSFPGPTVRRRRADHRAFGWRRPLAIGSAALLLLGGALYSVPVTRAAFEDAAASVEGVFSGWLVGDSADAPGRPAAAGDAGPEYLYDHSYAREPRVIAEAGDYRLFAYIEPSGGIGFDLGDTGVGLGFEAGELGREPLHVLGPGAMQHADPQGHVPLFGVAAREVTSVELTYETGPPLQVEGVAGGFVLLAEPARGPREVLALDADGEVLGRELVDDSPHPGPRIDWRAYVAR